MSEEALQIAEKRREVKGKGEKERYTHLNAKLQRIARRDKKAFLSNQCKEIEGNNRMGKSRDLFKKIRDTKRIFHVNMGTIKDRNGMDLTEAEDIRRGDKNIQKNYIQISNIDISLFQILKDDAVKVLHSICQQIWKIQQWPQD